MEPLIHRRTLLRGGLGLGFGLGLGLSPLMARVSRASGSDRSLILLWLQGGPSQLETWDPHPGTRIGGETRAIDTRVPGLRIAEFYPQVAEQMHHLSVVRSLVTKEGDHERASYHLKTGYRINPTARHPSLSAVVGHENPNPTSLIPQHVSLGGGEYPGWGGYLGPEHDAFKIVDPGKNLDNLRAPVEESRQSRRLAGLERVSRSFALGRGKRVSQTQHQETIDRALQMMSSSELAAFDLDEEPAAVREAYGDHRFGRGCLVARRLVERGVRAVEVTLKGFDSHAANFETHRENGEVLDAAMSNLVKDLAERDLLRKTVVVCLGEFGRTPHINSLDGRDHWPHAFSCVLGGGGLRAGVLVGETDSSGDKRAPKDPVQPQDLTATILTALGVDPTTELYTDAGRPLVLSPGRPRRSLLKGAA